MVTQERGIGLHWLGIFFLPSLFKFPRIFIPDWYETHQIPLKYNQQLKGKRKIAFNVIFKSIFHLVRDVHFQTVPHKSVVHIV